MPHHDFQVVRLHIALCASILKSIDNTIEGEFQLGINILAHKMPGEVFIVDGGKKLLQCFDMVFDVAHQPECLQQDNGGNQKRYSDMPRLEYRPSQQGNSRDQ